MDFYSMTDKGIMLELGARIRALRLRRNLTQQALADATMLSVNVIKSLEAGKGKLSSLIAVLRQLGELDGLNQLVAEQDLISPLEMARRKNQPRQRATGSRGSADDK